MDGVKLVDEYPETEGKKAAFERYDWHSLADHEKVIFWPFVLLLAKDIDGVL